MKRKLLFALLAVTVLLLCAGTALAAGLPCDKCGGATSKTGSGSSCSWYCQSCDYTSRRSHDPNASSSGLVPDSCTGHCRWCGASAVYSSHVFNKYVSNGDVTCLKDGTETARCANPACSQTSTRTATGSAPGHQYKQQTRQPTCVKPGNITFVCSRCGDSFGGDALPALGHTYGKWVCENNFHASYCTRPNCLFSTVAYCSLTTVQIGGSKITMCSICGTVSSSEGSADLEASENVTVTTPDNSRLAGDLTVLVDAAPIDAPVAASAFYMLVVSMNRDGLPIEPTGPVEISVDLTPHPFVKEGSSLSDTPISEINARTFKLYRVDQETVGEETRETWHEVTFALKHGVLTFSTDKMGVFLLMPNAFVPPAAD